MTSNARGRPRLIETDEAIRSATLSLLTEVGYAGLTFEAVARRAGVGKPTVYRRHDSRESLVAAAFLESLDRANPTLPDTGDVSNDVRLLLTNLSTALGTTDFGPAVREVIAPASRSPQLAELIDATVEERRELIRSLLQRAESGGRLKAENVEVGIDLLLGGIYYRHLITRGSLDERFVADLVAAVVEPA